MGALRSVSLTTPEDRSSYRVPVTFTLSAKASDSDGPLSGIEFYQNRTRLQALSAPPCSVSVNADPAATCASQREPRFARQREQLSIARRFTLSATVNDSDGSIAKVEFYEGTTLIRTLTQ